MGPAAEKPLGFAQYGATSGAAVQHPLSSLHDCGEVSTPGPAIKQLWPPLMRELSSFVRSLPRFSRSDVPYMPGVAVDCGSVHPAIDR